MEREVRTEIRALRYGITMQLILLPASLSYAEEERVRKKAEKEGRSMSEYEEAWGVHLFGVGENDEKLCITFTFSELVKMLTFIEEAVLEERKKMEEIRKQEQSVSSN